MHMLYVVGWVRGVTWLDNVMYVVCYKSSTILLYNTDTYSPLDVVINVDRMRNPSDIAICRDDRQLYVADCYCIWRVSADDHSYVKWLTTQSTTDTFDVDTLSVTSRRVLVKSCRPPGLRQYSTTNRQLLHHVPLPPRVKDLWHAVETTRQTFVIGHTGTSQNERQHAVSELFSFFTVGEWI